MVEKEKNGESSRKGNRNEDDGENIENEKEPEITLKIKRNEIRIDGKHTITSEKKQESETSQKSSKNDNSQRLERINKEAYIHWNIADAFEINPSLNLQESLRKVQEHWVTTPGDTSKFNPEELRVANAFFAWKELGNSNADSLHKFIETTRDRVTVSYKFIKIDGQGSSCLKSGQESSCLKSSSKDQGPRLREQLTASSENACMEALVLWNISRALERNPTINIRVVMRKVQDNLENKSQDLCSMMQEDHELRYLACALLAWQRLGHNNADSLHDFIKSRKMIPTTNTAPASQRCSCANLRGPVIRVPKVPKVTQSHKCIGGGTQNKKELEKKVHAACFLDSECMKQLSELGVVTANLRTRAGKLSHRETERVKLLERAEDAWKDLELGFQRRLRKALEKEDDYTKQIKNLIEERNLYKKVCVSSENEVKVKNDLTEKERVRLTAVEKDLCNQACERMRLSKEVLRGDATVSDEHTKLTQMERDLKSKEAQTRRQLQLIENDVESARTLTVATERLMRAELCSLSQQVTEISQLLVEEDKQNIAIKQELNDLNEEKMAMLDVLDSCKLMCDGRINSKMQEMRNKRETLRELSMKVMECRCKIPIDVKVQVKRTPSLATLCNCEPNECKMNTCSCTSIRTRLLSYLLADLFRGLQSELGEAGLKMSCQLLKCLEDKHNWDRPGPVLTLVQNYFSQLLSAELDIAIATALENCHARWVGVCCIEDKSVIPDFGDPESEESQERKTQELATKLAEELFESRAREIVQRAKEIVDSGPPPCACQSSQKPAPAKPSPPAQSQPDTAVYSCIVNPPTMMKSRATDKPTDLCKESETCLRQTLQDVSNLKIDVENLKKDYIKKEDLKLMEKNITNIMQRTSIPDNTCTASKKKPVRLHNKQEFTKIEKHTPKRKQLESNKNQNNGVSTNKSGQEIKGHGKKRSNLLINHSDLYDKKSAFTFRKQEYAVNVCICSSNANQSKISEKIKKKQSANSTAPTPPPLLDKNNSVKDDAMSPDTCGKSCNCFNKKVSSSSLNKLLKSLPDWKCENCEVDQKGNPNSNKLTESEDKISLKNKEIGDKTSMKNKEISAKSSIKSKESRGTNKTHCSKSNCKESCWKDKQKIKSIDCDTNTCKRSCWEEEMEVERNLAMRSESVYMGAINLERSNDQDSKKNSLKFSDTYPNAKVNASTQNMQSTLLPYEYDYNIKFLGVALYNTINKNPDKNVYRNNDSKNEDSDLDPRCKSKVTKNNTARSHKPISSCQCNIMIEKLNNKNQGAHSNHKAYKNDFQSNYEEPSLQLPFRKQNLYASSEILNSHDSEYFGIGTFETIEKHLRKKLDSFDVSCFTSYDGKESLYSSILEKVKQIILDNINTTTSKSSPKSDANINWDKVYSLLQDYLETKITRVQCSCTSDQNKELCDIMEAISNSIEDDLQRLKNIYSRKKTIQLSQQCNNEEEENHKINIKNINMCSCSVSISPEINEKNHINGEKWLTCDNIDSIDRNFNEAPILNKKKKNITQNSNKNLRTRLSKIETKNSGLRNTMINFSESKFPIPVIQNSSEFINIKCQQFETRQSEQCKDIYKINNLDTLETQTSDTHLCYFSAKNSTLDLEDIKNDIPVKDSLMSANSNEKFSNEDSNNNYNTKYNNFNIRSNNPRIDISNINKKSYSLNDTRIFMKEQYPNTKTLYDTVFNVETNKKILKNSMQLLHKDFSGHYNSENCNKKLIDDKTARKLKQGSKNSHELSENSSDMAFSSNRHCNNNQTICEKSCCAKQYSKKFHSLKESADKALLLTLELPLKKQSNDIIHKCNIETSTCDKSCHDKELFKTLNSCVGNTDVVQLVSHCVPLESEFKELNHSSNKQYEQKEITDKYDRFHCNLSSNDKNCLKVLEAINNQKKYDENRKEIIVLNYPVETLKEADKTNLLQEETNWNTEAQREIGRRNSEKPQKLVIDKAPFYIGYTIECTCDTYQSSCNCCKSMIQDNSKVIHNIWKTVENRTLEGQNISYIFDNITAITAEKNKKNSLSNNDFSKHLGKNFDAKLLNRPKCKSTNRASETQKYHVDSDELKLKQSRKDINMMQNSTNTSKISLNIESHRTCPKDEPQDFQTFGFLPSKESKNVICEYITQEKSNTCLVVHANKKFTMENEKKYLNLKQHPTILSVSVSESCDCHLVPICHVKMLMENLEDKFINAKCTCDSLSSKVCAVHSKVQS